MAGLLIRNAEVEGARTDVRADGGRVCALGPGLAAGPGDRIVEAAGGALLPGLHDHHLHLLAWAAARTSAPCGPPEVRSERALAERLRAAAEAAHAAGPTEAAHAAGPTEAAHAAGPREPAGGGFVRGVGYHESVAGPLDRDRLDAFVPGAALRVQHRSGALWMLSSEACRRIGLDAGEDAPGVERDATGRATGRLFRLDAWLRERIPEAGLPPLAGVGAALARFGVTGATDATPDLAPDAVVWLAAARSDGALPQRLVLLGAGPSAPPGVAVGPEKLVLDERALPSPDQLVARLREARAVARSVAIHCVTRAELVLALAALEEAGVRPGDRIEHASVAPPELVAWLARLGVTVVTQPGFVRTRGDDYLRDVDTRDRPWLYRCRGFDAAGVPLGGGSDAPFGDPDPWLAMQAALDRRTAAGALLGEAEGVSPERALALFTTPAAAPGGSPRRVALGAVADLCLLDRPWRRVRDSLESGSVAATICAGDVIYERH